jgi:Integrase zinc binding domain
MFYWSKLKDDVIAYVHSCVTCQMIKPKHSHVSGLLQPLPVPDLSWSSVGMDFITGLPKLEGKDVIVVIVDRFTKFAHFIPLSHPYSAYDVASSFFEHVYTLHELPTSIITDRDPIFTTKFWRELLKLFVSNREF